MRVSPENPFDWKYFESWLHYSLYFCKKNFLDIQYVQLPLPLHQSWLSRVQELVWVNFCPRVYVHICNVFYTWIHFVRKNWTRRSIVSVNTSNVVSLCFCTSNRGPRSVRYRVPNIYLDTLGVITDYFLLKSQDGKSRQLYPLSSPRERRVSNCRLSEVLECYYYVNIVVMLSLIIYEITKI